MTMKILDRAVWSLFAAAATSVAMAQEAPMSSGVLTDASPVVSPVATPAAGADAVAVAGDAAANTPVQLFNGGVVWATEDPALGVPELAVSAPALVAFEEGRIAKAVAFYVRTNYPGFIRRYELTVYRASDTALTEPLAAIDVPVAAVSRVEWAGDMAARYPLRVGDDLMYVLRAYGADGNVDETYPQTLQLARTQEVERGEAVLRDAAERAAGTAFSVSQAQSARLIDRVFSGSGLRQQNIAIYGSRVRIQGRNLPPDHVLLINGDSYPVDLERKFVAEFLEPIGRHRYELALTGADNKTVFERTLGVDVSGTYFFGVGIADLTVFQNRATGPGRLMALDGNTHDVLSNGRLAFYGKSKIEGKYLVTAQADTQERRLGDLFSGFTRADPKDVFRRLDPNLYYPTYGDDSTTARDVDTQGRLYLRVDWDKSQALWGNYDTGFTGTEFANYVRSLYGAAIHWRSKATNPWGEPLSLARAFASEAQTAPGHSEFIGTGGSLYYLRHTDILRGSEVVVVEVRDLATGRVEARTTLQRGVDYELNELQGRILLNQPLAQVTSVGLSSITRDTPLAGRSQYLLVDYEWVPGDFTAGNLAAGVRGKQWVTDHVAVGGTLVEEKRAGDNYTLAGADLTLQAGRGTFFKLEHSKTESTGTPIFFSNNGGFSFTQSNNIAGHREGRATAIDAQANLKELGYTDRAWTLATWWRTVDAGYSVSRIDTGLAVKEAGAQVRGQIGDNVSVLGLGSRADRGADALSQAQLTAEWRVNEDDKLTAELRRVSESHPTGDLAATLGALKYTRRLSTRLEAYGLAQKSFGQSGGYRDNDALTLGAKYRFTELSTVGGEVTKGDRGNAAQVNAEYRLSPAHTLYGAYTYTTDDSSYDALFNPRQQGGLTLGQRWRLSERVNLFNESQYLKEAAQSGVAHTFGMDFYPRLGWSTGFTLQQGELEGSTGTVHREAVSLNAGRTSPETEWRSKIEWRRDTGAEQRTQWVSTNRLNHKIDDSWRVSARFNYADTQDKTRADAGAKYIESGAGFAWRPYNDARYALLGRYTYLYDLATQGQQGGAQYDQKSSIVSLEGIYRVDRRWELVAKLARRDGQARLGRGTGLWFDSATRFAAVQVRYELPAQWHALAEYRALAVKAGGTRSGWLVGLDRDIGANLRVGVGYNFTTFSDDLTKFGYKYKGLFINLVGSY